MSANYIALAYMYDMASVLELGGKGDICPLGVQVNILANRTAPLLI